MIEVMPAGTGQDEIRETVTSPDGTTIAYRRSGTGPPLILVHGTAADHTRWRPVVPILREQFSVCVLDRRGRGGSGDTEPYAIEREYEDIVAVIGTFGSPVSVLGHSYGGICALGASLLASNLDRMVLYEPPVRSSGTLPPGLVDRLEASLAAGRPEEALVAFCTEVLRMTPAQLESFRALAAWPARVAAAHTLPRELRTADAYRLDGSLFAANQTPTLILEGGESPAFLRASTAAVHDVLPNSSIVVMPGQQHVAMDTAPDLFTKLVVDFLTT
ncbi:MAG: alpha/beta fold hydrolase [Actinomycetota bacterium]